MCPSRLIRSLTIEAAEARHQKLSKMGKAVIIFALALFVPLGLAATNPLQRYNASELKCIEQFCVPPDYNKHERPFIGSSPMEILVDFDVAQVVEINDVKFSIKFIMYIGLTWVDPRIVCLKEAEEISWMPVDIEFGNYMWLPDLYIYDVQEIIFPKYYKQFGGQNPYEPLG